VLSLAQTVVVFLLRSRLFFGSGARDLRSRAPVVPAQRNPSNLGLTIEWEQAAFSYNCLVNVLVSYRTERN